MEPSERLRIVVHPPPEQKYTAPHYDQHLRVAEYICRSVTEAEWRVEPERLTKEK